MRTSCRLLFALISLASLGLADLAVARARPEPGRKAEWLAAPEVVSLTTLRLPEGWRVRALVLETGRTTSLVVESQGPRGRVDRQVEVDALMVDGRPLRMELVEQLSDVAFVRDALSFNAIVDRRRVDCVVPLDQNGLPRMNVAQCGPATWDDHGNPGGPPDDHHGHPPMPPIIRPQWSRLPVVISACGDAFTGEQNELACLDQVDDFRSDPVAAIRACESYTTGDANAMACLGTVDRIVGDPTPLIQACESYTTGDANMLRCTAEVQQLSFPPNDMPAVIAACESATTGDDNMLRCVGALRGVQGGAAATLQLIRACDEAMSGDDAMLSCIGRGR